MIYHLTDADSKEFGRSNARLLEVMGMQVFPLAAIAGQVRGSTGDQSMLKIRILLAVLFVGVVSFGAYRAADDKKDAPKYTTNEVMIAAHKGDSNLLKKVVDGTATQEDKDKLVDLYTAMAANTPKKGDAAKWVEINKPIVAAAKAVAADKDGSKKLVADLQKATACMACHKEFK